VRSLSPDPNPANHAASGAKLPLQQRTLTSLYNRRPDWLAAAHKRIDAAVLAAYGWPEDLSDEVLARLLPALDLARAAGVRHGTLRDGVKRSCRYGDPGVSQLSRSPDCSPSLSAIWRCSDDPCVHDSGAT
jgi:hypothetical protein